MQEWLFDISNRLQSLMSVLDESEDKSIEPDIKNAIQTIYGGEIVPAVEDGILYIKKQEKQIEEIADNIKRLQALKKSREARLDRVKKGYIEFIGAVGKKKIETTKGDMSVARTAGKVIVVDINRIPPQYTRSTVQIDVMKDDLKKALQAGAEIDGAHLEGGVSLRIK